MHQLLLWISKAVRKQHKHEELIINLKAKCLCSSPGDLITLVSDTNWYAYEWITFLYSLYSLVVIIWLDNGTIVIILFPSSNSVLRPQNRMNYLSSTISCDTLNWYKTEEVAHRGWSQSSIVVNHNRKPISAKHKIRIFMFWQRQNNWNQIYSFNIELRLNLNWT